MTAPSALLEAVETVLRTRIGSEAVDVRTAVGEFIDLGDKETLTFKSPGLIIAMQAMPAELERDWSAGAPMNVLFVVACHARAKDSSDQRTAGKVAMDLAGLVCSVVRGERWNDLAQTKAERLRAVNETDRELRKRGIAAWSVSWLQGIELDLPESPEALASLASITHTFAMGDEGIGPPNDDPQSTTEFA